MSVNRTVNGVSINVMANSIHTLNGLLLGLYNSTYQVKGLQIGLINRTRELKGFQFGLWNINSTRRLPIVNWSFRKNT